jgi:Fe-S-cluster-containing dehydrogenase component
MSSKETVMSASGIDEYKDAMREEICRLCVSFAADGKNPTCVHEHSGQCSLFANLGEVVEVVSKVHSGSIVPYLEELRGRICTKCAHQDARGVCNLRDNRGPVPTWCSLDAYFNIVVGAIEGVRERHGGMVS